MFWSAPLQSWHSRAISKEDFISPSYPITKRLKAIYDIVVFKRPEIRHDKPGEFVDTSSFENTGRRGLGHFRQNPSIPSFQHGVLESRFHGRFRTPPCEPGCRPSMPAWRWSPFSFSVAELDKSGFINFRRLLRRGGTAKRKEHGAKRKADICFSHEFILWFSAHR
jgi:hypothetical protein